MLVVSDVTLEEMIKHAGVRLLDVAVIKIELTDCLFHWRIFPDYEVEGAKQASAVGAALAVNKGGMFYLFNKFLKSPNGVFVRRKP